MDLSIFINRLNCLSGIKFDLEGKIEKLSQQEYRGKRAHITVRDTPGYIIHSKIDLGVHARAEIEQEDYCFDVCVDDEGASLLINSKEQIFVEKLCSLLRWGVFSTRFKDVYDIYYLSNFLDVNRLLKYLDIYIFSDSSMRENCLDDVLNRMRGIFANGSYIKLLEKSESANWMNVDPSLAMKGILCFLSGLSSPNT